MSLAIMAEVWKTKCGNCTAKLVLIALADNANDQRVCWPSLENLAVKCDLTIQGVRNQIKKLEEEGFLVVERSGGRASNRYIVLPNPPGQPPIPLRVDRPTTPNTVEGSTPNHIGQPPTPLTPTPNTVDPNRKEPSKEPSVPVPSTASSRKTEFERGWCDRFQIHFGTKYFFSGGKDAQAAKRLVEGLPDSLVSDLLAIAESAWCQTNEPGKWACNNQSKTICKFAAAINDIRIELAVSIPPPRQGHGDFFAGCKTV